MGQVIGLILIIALAGDLLLAKAYLGVRDRAAKAQQAATQATDAARKCSEGTEKLVQAAEQRGADGARAALAAAAAALPHKQSAQRILASRPSTPGNACKSAEDHINEWLKGRPQ